MGESKTVLPVVQLRVAEPKGVSETPLQKERPASIGHAIPVTETVGVVEPEETETPPIGQQPITEHSISKNEPPPAPPVQEQQTASLINQTLSMVAVAICESTVPLAPPPYFYQPVAKPISKDIVLKKLLVQKEQAASLIAEALSMVKSVSAEAKPAEVGAPSFQQPTKPVEADPSSSQKPFAKELTVEERLAMERDRMRKRVETFKANQQRFQREREEYYEATMAKVRASGPRQ